MASVNQAEVVSGPGITTQPRRYSLLLFVSLAFLISWAAWLPGTVASFRSSSAAYYAGPTLLGAFGPLLAALITTAARDGQSGFRQLGRRLVTWRVKPRWYAFALLWPAALSLASSGVSMLLGAPAPAFDRPPFLDAYPVPAELKASVPWLGFLPVVFVQQLLLGSSMGEEPGWRGYALPRLQWRHNSLAASLGLGLVWGVWHLPLWARPDQQGVRGAGWELLAIVAVTVLFTWVFNHTKGSLLLALLLHTSMAVTALFLASSEAHPAVDVLLTWTLVVVIVANCGTARLSRAEAPHG